MDGFRGTPRKIRLWLSRQQDESYLLTTQKPIRAKMRGENYDWFYPQIGEPIQIELCEVGVKKLIGVDLQIFESIRVDMMVEHKENN